MAITDKTRKLLWGRSGNRCAICSSSVGVARCDTSSPARDESGNNNDRSIKPAQATSSWRMKIAPFAFPEDSSRMATIVEVEKLALNLPESLPAVLSDEDEGIGEALRRDAEIDADPNHAISFAQLDSQIQNR